LIHPTKIGAAALSENTAMANVQIDYIISPGIFTFAGKILI